MFLPEALLVLLVVTVLVVARAAEALLVVFIIAILVIARAAEKGLRAGDEGQGSHCDWSRIFIPVKAWRG